MRPAARWSFLGTCGAFLLGVLWLHGGVEPQTGPQTEKRFPPLQVPAGFKATLFACDPLIEYPSVIAAGPRPGALFVAIDYLTGLGTDLIRRHEVPLAADARGHGDADLNVFVRDNENDGGTYMIRVCHSFHGADHGYPYLYTERPDEALPPLADLGRGSSAGVVCYRETQFPPEYRGNLFGCEWGRA